MGEDTTVLREEIHAYSDGTVTSVRILAVPASERFPNGIKFAFHFGVAGDADPIVRFDNHHGPWELHVGPTTYDVGQYSMLECYRAWRAALPESKRSDW